MKTRASRWAMLALSATLPVAGSTSDLAASELALQGGHRAAAIRGVWDSQVTVHTCDANRIELARFRALNLFEEDGSLVATSEIAQPPSLGKWQWLGGRKFRAKFRFQRFAAGVFQGITQVTREIELAPRADTFRSVVRTEFYDTNDVLMMNGCGTEAATRVF